MKKGIQFFTLPFKGFLSHGNLVEEGKKMIERKCTDQFMFPKTTDETQRQKNIDAHHLYVSSERKNMQHIKTVRTAYNITSDRQE